jgi:cell division protein ZapA (FtsZ GTPase activity inhibitor)
LFQRVDDLLHVRNSAYIVEEIENSAAVVILDELRKAEEELKTVQKRITRLRELLANAQSAEQD